jgi:hypothetical protein
MVEFDNFDTVIVVGPSEVRDELYFALKDKVKELYRVGDCLAPRKTDMAIVEGNRLGRML